MAVAGGKATQYKKHFRHTGESCHEYPSGEETEAHIEGKHEIAETLRSDEDIDDVEIEHEMDGGIPDVHFTTDGDAYSVELQVSHISLRDLRQRTKDRTRNGLYTVWLFHADHYDTRKTSRNGNEYVEFKTGEMAYIDAVSGSTDSESVWLPYYETDGRAIGTAHKISLFDDGGGGWVDKSKPFHKVAPAILPSGLKLGLPKFAVPEKQGDARQSRLF
jgi:hypothetical protein